MFLCCPVSDFLIGTYNGSIRLYLPPFEDPGIAAVFHSTWGVNCRRNSHLTLNKNDLIWLN